MVPASLDVERSQVEAARAGRAEQKVAHPIHHLVVHLLGLLRGLAAQEGRDVAIFLDEVWVEEGVLEG